MSLGKVSSLEPAKKCVPSAKWNCKKFNFNRLRSFAGEFEIQVLTTDAEVLTNKFLCYSDVLSFKLSVYENRRQVELGRAISWFDRPIASLGPIRLALRLKPDRS